MSLYNNLIIKFLASRGLDVLSSEGELGCGAVS